VPVYEYRCKKCRAEVEYLQRMSDPPKKKCEACGGPLERLISQTSFQLKGSGWYKDLYSSSKPAAAAASSEGGGGEASAGASGGEAKKESGTGTGTGAGAGTGTATGTGTDKKKKAKK
jgi:putative FmdB family regulatory protein